MKRMKAAFEAVLQRYPEVALEVRSLLLEELLKAWKLDSDRRVSEVQQELSTCVVKLDEAYKTKRLLAFKEAIRYFSLEARHTIDQILHSSGEEDEVLK
jgi:hypothetical protein